MPGTALFAPYPRSARRKGFPAAARLFGGMVSPAPDLWGVSPAAARFSGGAAFPAPPTRRDSYRGQRPSHGGAPFSISSNRRKQRGTSAPEGGRRRASAKNGGPPRLYPARKISPAACALGFSEGELRRARAAGGAKSSPFKPGFHLIKNALALACPRFPLSTPPRAPNRTNSCPVWGGILSL